MPPTTANCRDIYTAPTRGQGGEPGSGSGVIGLFLRAVVLALGYKLLLVWLQQEKTWSSG